ncbi:MAG: Kelch repeat-containing protein, partial [Planctomycetota bacterium]
VLSCAHDTPSPSGFHVVSIEPADGATSVSLQQNIRITFSADVHTDSVVGTQNILVVNDKNQVLRGTLSVSGADVTFSPAGSLEADKTYGIAVRRTVFDLEGVPLQYPRAAIFSTGATIEPIDGFPPFEEYPLAPDPTKIVAEIRGTVTQVQGSADAVERPTDQTVNVNIRNQTQSGDWVHTAAAQDGSFAADLTGVAEGDLIEISASFPLTGKTGPAVTVTAIHPFSWNLLPASGTAPSSRQGHTAIYDPDNHRMVLFGGTTSAFGFGGALDDLFTLDLTSGAEGWTEWLPATTGTPPSSRWGHTAVFDPGAKRMIVFGGDDGALGVLNDVWAFDLTTGTWAPISTLGTPPNARALHAALFDPSGSRMFVFCGRGPFSLTSTQFDDLYTLNFPAAGLPTWQSLTASGTSPGLREGLFGILDSGANRIVAGFGNAGGLYLPDTYTLDLATNAWSLVLSVPTSTGRGSAAVTLDTLHQRLLIFGGASTTEAYDDLFTYDLGAGTWSTLTPEGSGPSPRSGATMIFDPVGDRGILFGGGDLTSTNGDLFQLR